jgi:hypothetical protein
LIVVVLGVSTITCAAALTVKTASARQRVKNEERGMDVGWREFGGSDETGDDRVAALAAAAVLQVGSRNIFSHKTGIGAAC